MLDFTDQTRSEIFIVLWMILHASGNLSAALFLPQLGQFWEFWDNLWLKEKLMTRPFKLAVQTVRKVRVEKTADPSPCGLQHGVQFQNDAACASFVFVTDKG